MVDAGLVSGDLTFPIPFCPEFHFSEFNSAVADMKNSVAVRLSYFIFILLKQNYSTKFNHILIDLRRIVRTPCPPVLGCSSLPI